MKKDHINKLRKAARILPVIFKEAKALVVPGVREEEVAAFIKKRLKEFDATKPSFRIIVGSGRRSTIPHGWASKKKIKKGELVVIDFGALLNGVRSDYTRTVMVGKPTRKQRKIIQAVKVAQKRAMAKVKAGVTCAEVDAAARNYLKKQKLDKYFIHTTGHGIGIKTHEPPKISSGNKNRLEAGMVVTIEPGVYIKGVGGVRIEDMLLVKKNGYEILTR